MKDEKLSYDEEFVTLDTKEQTKRQKLCNYYRQMCSDRTCYVIVRIYVLYY